MKFLLEHGAAVNEPGLGGTTALHCAISDGTPGVIELLLDYCAEGSLTDGRGMSAIEYASRGGDARLVAALRPRLRQVAAVASTTRP